MKALEAQRRGRLGQDRALEPLRLRKSKLSRDLWFVSTFGHDVFR